MRVYRNGAAAYSDILLIGSVSAGDMSISSFFRNVILYFKITSRISVCFRDVIYLSEIPSRNNLFFRYEITAFAIASRNDRVFCYGISISENPLHNSSKYRPAYRSARRRNILL